MHGVVWMKSQRRGFTLIELLVVIAIIAILAAILFPVFASAKERGRQAMCLSNLKQLMMGIREYTDDNNGLMPRCIEWGAGRPDWSGNQTCGVAFPVTNSLIWKYVRSKRMYACPTDLNVRGVPGWPLSYSMNWKMGMYDTTRALIKLEAETAGRSGKVMVLLHEKRDRINDGFYAWGNGWDIPSEIHYSGTTVVYADGHAKWGTQTALIKEMSAPRSHWLNNTEFYRP